MGTPQVLDPPSGCAPRAGSYWRGWHGRSSRRARSVHDYSLLLRLARGARARSSGPASRGRQSGIPQPVRMVHIEVKKVGPSAAKTGYVRTPRSTALRAPTPSTYPTRKRSPRSASFTAPGRSSPPMASPAGPSSSPRQHNGAKRSHRLQACCRAVASRHPWIGPGPPHPGKVERRQRLLTEDPLYAHVSARETPDARNDPWSTLRTPSQIPQRSYTDKSFAGLIWLRYTADGASPSRAP